MSVQINTYVMRGALFPYAQFKDRHDELEPYMDSAFEGVRHHEGLCVLFDGMDGKYVAIGRVIAKTPDHEGFIIPITVSAIETGGDDLEARIEALAKQPVTVETLVISHYR